MSTHPSVPKQQKPYAGIETAIEQSAQVNTGPVSATLVGFYAPDFMFPIKGKGLHLHGVTQQQDFGGHVLELKLKAVEVKFEKITQFNIELPQHADYENLDLQEVECSDDIPVLSDVEPLE